MKDGEIEITAAREEDLGEILDLQKRAFVTEVLAHGNHDIEPLKQTYEDILADFATHKFLKAVRGGSWESWEIGESGEIGGKIVGSVKYRALADRVRLGKLIVDIECRGRGLGRRLLAAVEALNPGAGKFQLFTAASSSHNIRLYESAGYRVVREFPDPEQDGFPMVEMIKEA